MNKDQELVEKIANETYAKHCDCGDSGAYAVANNFTGEPEMEQCEFCYTQNSYFNLKRTISLCRQHFRTDTLDEAILAVNDEMNQTVGSKAHAIKAIDKLRGGK